jgi:hypothetical protein
VSSFCNKFQPEICRQNDDSVDGQGEPTNDPEHVEPKDSQSGLVINLKRPFPHENHENTPSENEAKTAEKNDPESELAEIHFSAQLILNGILMSTVALH